ncbi:MAG: DEAD/DEAH box helicase [Myxococcales bacterium]|nr:DEAD/DEAH box helicase [Myxococcales bacterium]
MEHDLEPLFAAIRKASGPRIWSRGVELARAGAVVGEREDDDEIVLRVAVKGSPVAPAVTLFPEDEEWECECASRADACFHVAAAVIALKRAREGGEALPSAGARTARVAYRLRRTPDGLALDRALVRGEGEGPEEPLQHRLTEYASGRIEGAPALFTSADDMTIEVTLGALSRGVPPTKMMREILRHLTHGADVRLDGAPMTVSADALRPHVKIADDGEGFRITLVRDPSITELFANGVALCGDTLHPTAPSGLSRDEVRRLKAGITYPREQAAGIVTEVIPHLEKHTTVHIRSKRLPRKKASIEPRLCFETARLGDSLTVLPTIVYGDPAIARVDGDRLVTFGDVLPERDRRLEDRLRLRLERKLEMSPGRKALFSGEAAMAIGERLSGIGELRGDGHRHFFAAGPLDAKIDASGGGLRVSFTSESGGERREVDAARVLRAWEQGEAWIPLDGGGFAPLPADWLARYGHHLTFLLAARDADGQLKAWARPALAQLLVDLDAPAGRELGELRALVGDFEGLPEVELPSDLKASLRDYQVAGVRWLTFLRRAGLGALLADDMGLGKTLQTIATLKSGERALCVVPTSVLHAWEGELRRFRPALRVHRYYGPGRALDPDAEVTLTTYALLRLDREALRCADALAERPWDLVVLDEAQTIKNPESQTAQAAFDLVAHHRVALSGTPVENRLDELWSLLFFLNRGLLGSRREFRERYAQPIADGSPEAAARLRQRIRPFVLRRRKSEVARELPPRTEVVLRCQLDRRERELYEALQAATRKEVIAQLAAGKGVLQALEALLRLRQAACHRGLIPGQDAATSSKVELLVETLDEVIAEGHKALVFSQWTSLLDRIEPALTKAGLAFCRLDGSTRDRAAVVDTFQDPAGPPVMLISLKAGGTGLTLTAADNVFLVDPWWNPAVEDQAADRAHRIGQDRPVLIQRLVAEETVEEKILALQERKRALADAALGDADQAIALTRDDLLALLE